MKHWIDSRYGMDIAKDDPRLLQVKDAVDAEYEAGRTSTVSEEEMARWARQAFGEVDGWRPVRHDAGRGTGQ